MLLRLASLRSTAKHLKQSVLFFLGAGSSIPAGLNGVATLVADFRNWLESEHKTDCLDIIENIIFTIKQSKEKRGDKDKIDIEMLLEAIEKIEKRDQDVLQLFYDKNTFTLSNCKCYDLISDGKTLLSEEVKKFIKVYFTEKEMKVEYLKPLIAFIKDYKPLDIFSTNYDICIEKFCKLNDKEYVDGFNPKWNPEVLFHEPNADVRLYKLHGSVTWYRTEQGEYEGSNILIKDMKVRLATGKAVPFIVYPGRKLEYNEPTIDTLVELKRQLKSVKYVFVIGYSFRDDHISKIFRYAARINREFIIFLISPSAHNIYYFTLKRHLDDEFPHSYTHESYSQSGYNTDLASDLEGRVIRLPYRFEKIIHLLKNKYLENLMKGQQCEIQREIDLDNLADKQIAVSKWYDCLLPYIECEHIDKVEKIIEDKMGWDELMMNRDYRLGSKIIVKSLLNVLPFEAERRKWLERLKKYIPISPENLEVYIENEKVYILFRLKGQYPLYGDDALKFYESLLDIYKDHPIFFNDKKFNSIEDGKQIIKKACNYLEVWKDTTLSLDDYVNIRKNKYEAEVAMIENSLHNKNSNNVDELRQVLNEFERKVLTDFLS